MHQRFVPARKMLLVIVAALALIVTGCQDSVTEPRGADSTGFESIGSVDEANPDNTCSADPSEGCTIEGDPGDDDGGGVTCDQARTCGDTGGGGGDDTSDPRTPGDGGGTPGGDYDPSGGGNTAGDDTGYDCHFEGNPKCVLDAASSAQKDAMAAAVKQHINAERCPSLYSAALGLVGSAQVWKETITLPTGTLRGDYSNVTGQMHIWAGNFKSPDYWLPWTLAHEAAHAIGHRTETEAHAVGDSCLNFEMRH